MTSEEIRLVPAYRGIKSPEHQDWVVRLVIAESLAAVRHAPEGETRNIGKPIIIIDRDDREGA
jgi:hypothetical protein